MQPISQRSVLEVIREQYHQVFSAERKVADYILQNPQTAINANVSELARESGVSDATIVRFCKHVGYEGYYQMKIYLARDLGRQQSTEAYLESVPEDTAAGYLQKLAAGIAAIGQRLSQEKLEKCVELIRACPQVHLAAVGNTSPLAQYMGFRLGRLGIRSTYNMVPECMMNHVNLAGSGDILIAISQSGSSKQVIQAMELAKEKGLVTVAISAHDCSPVSALADYLFSSGMGEGSLSGDKNYSYIREMSIIETLLRFVANREQIAASGADNPEIIMSELKL
ncbi:MurR/RpiR family transcriptional regulator [Oscillospiraceae bacterium MB08-C2-2]|nr:MurR/RpiR family transcriptional regulator [Oscillospiraceae bacterium MB08-C2-2]